ncbi:MAG: hypothetical protein P4L99_01770, partial [Chthoniobacter sp.]|nr:hypothetical protein [Chthoniobacter sp.]
ACALNSAVYRLLITLLIVFYFLGLWSRNLAHLISLPFPPRLCVSAFFHLGHSPPQRGSTGG